MAKEPFDEISGIPRQAIEEEFISIAEMQRRIMPDPDRLTVFGDFDIYGRTLPIAVVGGDYHDFIDLESRFGIQGKMGIVTADAAGHGLAAAMLIRDFNTALYTAISFQSYYVQDTTPLLFTKINRRMYRSSQSNQYIAAFYGELQLSGVLRYMNAGHPNPMVFKKDQVVLLDKGGPVLGAFRDTPYEFEVGQAQLEPGDLLLCYTDGITEAASGEGEEYGLERLQTVVEKHRWSPSQQIFEAILEDVECFSSDTGQTDDRTVIVIKKV